MGSSSSCCTKDPFPAPEIVEQEANLDSKLAVDEDDAALLPPEDTTHYKQFFEDAHPNSIDTLEQLGIIVEDVNALEEEAQGKSPSRKSTQFVVNRDRTRSVGNLGEITGDSIDRVVRAQTRMSSREAPKEAAKVIRPDLEGHWKCVDTWGMDEFLSKVLKLGWAQRKLAQAARWPDWTFEKLLREDDDIYLFVNNTAMGVIKEEIEIGGSPYTSLNGENKKCTNTASWTGTGKESKLVIERDTPQGHFVEERSIDGSGKLVFVLTAKNPSNGQDVKWGRNFERST